MAIAGLVGAVVQLAIAIVTFGGFAAFFSHPALVALVILVFLMTAIAMFSEGNLSTAEREARGNRWVLAVFGVLALLLTVLPPYTDRRDILTIDGETTRWIGVAVLTVGSILRLYPVFVLGKRFSGLVAIQPGHRLVTTGIYAVIRNPSYLGLMVGALGWALAFRSIVGIVLALLNLIPLVARMDAEEKLLREHFGAEYDAYVARTKRLIPWIY
ncbi:MAG TPA: isoprenylcysteine carboxylmethyltransferase family protein [Methylovirgula sp.]